MLLPFLTAAGSPGAQVGLRSELAGEDAVSLTSFGFPDLYVGGLRDPSEHHLQGLSQVIADHRQWRGLLQDHDRLRDVYDRTFQFQGTLQPDGILMDANETLLAFTNTRRAQVLGRSLVEAPWWQQTPQNVQALRDALVMTGAHTAVAHGDLSLIPIRGKGGAIEMIALEGRDITEHLSTLHEVEVARASLETVLEHVQEGVIACDVTGRLTIFNRMAREWHGHGGESQQTASESWSREFQLYELDGVTLLPADRVPCGARFRERPSNSRRWSFNRTSTLLAPCSPQASRSGRSSRWTTSPGGNGPSNNCSGMRDVIN